jgi:hypothetical protein
MSAHKIPTSAVLTRLLREVIQVIFRSPKGAAEPNQNSAALKISDARVAIRPAMELGRIILRDRYNTYIRSEANFG